MTHAGLLTRADHPADSRAFQLTLTTRGVEVVTRAVGIVRSLHDDLLAPLGGRTGKRSVELMSVLQTLLRHANEIEHPQAVNRSKKASVARAGQPTKKRRAGV